VTATTTEVPTNPTPPTTDPGATAGAGRLLPRVGAAVAAGLLMLVAFPPYGQWWTAPVAVAALAWAVHRRRLRAGLGLGSLAGIVFFAPLLGWTNLHTGLVPWLLLSGLEALFVGVFGMAAAWTSGLADRWPWTAPLLTGALWTATEALRDRVPFGGFPWGRLAFSQADSPLLRLAAAGGAPLVTFAVATAGGLLAAAVAGRGRPVTWITPVAALALFGIAWVVPITPPAGRSVQVAIVQGNVPRLGLDFNAQRRAVLDNHVKATIALAEDVAAGRRPQPDLVIWPENSSDIDPFVNADATDAIDDAARAIKAPILVGAVLQDPAEGGVQNAALVWTPDHGVTARYTKRHPVPFAEYIPLRPIARLVSSEVDRVSTDFIPGHSPGVLTVGPATVGDVICFEVAYDGLVRDTVTGGGQLLTVQTNNATFDTAEAQQQLAMVRLRAVEHGRDALMASTVGISAFVDAHGTVTDATRFDTAAVQLRDLHLGGARTLATRLGAAPEAAIVAAAVAAVAWQTWAATARRRRRVARPAAAPTTEEDA
jgi:apolipoprotein N-acyltransferase